MRSQPVSGQLAGDSVNTESLDGVVILVRDEKEAIVGRKSEEARRASARWCPLDWR